MAVLFVSWNGNDLGLWGLPDVGDPFDVRKTGFVDVPAGSNAFDGYNRARTLLNPTYVLMGDESWAGATPEQRAYLTDSGPALAVWLEATARTEAVLVQPRDYQVSTSVPLAQDLREFAKLAILEGSRREAEGDMEGAWEYYRGVYRSSRHCGKHAPLLGRLIEIGLAMKLPAPIQHWAADPQVGAPLLRRALSDLTAIDATTAPLSETLHVEYIMLDNLLHDSNTSVLAACLPATPPLRWSEPNSWVGPPLGLKSRLVHSEPVRSRRLLRLVFANWLAHCDEPGAVPWKFSGLELAFYKTTDHDPVAARRLPAEELARAYEVSTIARHLIIPLQNIINALARERAAHAAMVATLTEQLALRERGPEPSPTLSSKGR